MTFKQLFQAFDKPPCYAESTAPFWDDDHISKGMLDAHLNPELDAATRLPDFVNRAVKWINELTQQGRTKNLLDLGCGPGIYAEKFAETGFEVTGIDFSKRSIDYAKRVNHQTKRNITYIHDNYLHINYQNQFDVITLIYCDYGVLSTENRLVLLSKIYQSLKIGGSFIFDVLTEHFYDEKINTNHWYDQANGGFYSPKAHVVLERDLSYENHVRLHEVFVIEDYNKTNIYRICDTTFTKESIKKELQQAGFTSVDFFSDLTGKPYKSQTSTLGIVATKE